MNITSKTQLKQLSTVSKPGDHEKLSTDRNIISRLRTRQQLCEHQTRANDSSAASSENSHVPTSQMSRIIQVAPLRNQYSPEDTFANRAQTKSEVLLRCSRLKLMENLDDPIKKMNCFESKSHGAEH